MGNRANRAPPVMANQTFSPSELKDLLNVFTKLELTGPQIKSLTQRLGVKLHVLDDVDASRRGAGADRKAHYLQAWLNIELAPTWKKIIAALRLMRLKAKARSLGEMVGVDSNPVDAGLPETSMKDAQGVLDAIESANSLFDSKKLSHEQMRALFRGIGVSNEELDDIDEDHVGDDRHSHYAQAWLNVEFEPTVQHIIDGLELIGKVTKAKGLQVNENVEGAREEATEGKKDTTEAEAHTET